MRFLLFGTMIFVLSFVFYISISSPGRLDICPVVPSYICLLPSRSALTRIITGFRLNSHRERERQTYQGNVIDYRVLQIATERCSTIQPADESVFVIIKSHLHFISLHPQRHHPPPHPLSSLSQPSQPAVLFLLTSVHAGHTLRLSLISLSRVFQVMIMAGHPMNSSSLVFLHRTNTHNSNCSVMENQKQQPACLRPQWLREP
ncbi:hypothetical protein P692DRAFT_20459702 [Suillus brevipes Sb2]|nr:hypothetical protein P692DRAFT_20459702 [Suillus brevipes Sb2]